MITTTDFIRYELKEKWLKGEVKAPKFAHFLSSMASLPIYKNDTRKS